MKLLRRMQIIGFASLLVGAIFVLNSCKNDDGTQSLGVGTIVGTVTEAENDSPIAGVEVSVSGVEGTVSTGSDGRYTVNNVSIASHAVSFAKAGRQAVSVTVTAGEFGDNKTAVANASMINASAKIVGTVVDAKNGNAPLAGVSVSLGAGNPATTGADGKYLIENLLEDDYSVTFTKTDYVTVIRPVRKQDFVGGIATLDVSMGGAELLRDKTAADLAGADKWYYNEYRGGRNADAYPHWDWACDYMCTLDFWGNWEEQNEGTTLRIRNDEADRSNPADLDVFDSYVYGSKLITVDNKILSVRLRTHNVDAAAPAHFGVQVVDLSASTPAAVKIGTNKTHGSGDYSDYDFDLSAYIGKEVIVAIGIYRQQTGDYWKQLVLRAIRFANQRVEGTGWLPGNEVIQDWKLTHETVRSTMPHTKKTFTGISPESGNRDNYVNGYRSWRPVNHVASEWSFVPRIKDPEVFASEGYVIKTRGTAETSTVLPEAYIYSKFAIAAGSNQLTLKARNFHSENFTYFKLTAIKEDGTVQHIVPASNTAESTLTAADGCFGFKHSRGDKNNPDQYASFVYDLSQFNGEKLFVAFGVYNVVANTGENKLAFYSIELN